VKDSSRNRDGAFTLKEPKEFAEYIDLLIGEINERLMDRNVELTDW
jgi:hypothetical protein